MRLVIIKNRNGRAWVSTDFKYYPLFNYFTEEDPAEEEPEADVFSGIRGQKAK